MKKSLSQLFILRMLVGLLLLCLVVSLGTLFYKYQVKRTSLGEEPSKESVKSEYKPPIIKKPAPPIEIEKTVSIVFAGKVEIKNLNKKYPNFSLENVSFSIPKGYITGFIEKKWEIKSYKKNCYS